MSEGTAALEATAPAFGSLPFDDGKAPAAMRTIGEIARAFGLKQHVLRYWEQQFPMLRPLQRSGGRRYYRPDDVALVERIDRLINREGYTLKGARQIIEAGAAEIAPVQAMGLAPAPVAPAPMAQLTGSDDFVAKLRDIRERLAKAIEAA